MNFGFIRVSSNSCNINIADCFFNAKEIIKSVKTSFENNVELAVFPELCITGYTCGDLFLQKSLIDDALLSLKYILEQTKDLNITFIVGMPFEYEAKLFNCGIVIYKGRILGIVPKTNLPNYSEFYEKRHFNPALKETLKVEILGQEVFFGTKLIFSIKNKENFKFAVEICEDLWSFIPPSSNHCMAGATVIANLSASNELIGKAKYRKSLVTSQSLRTLCSYIYCSSGEGESTTDTVFSAHNLISENGNLIAESESFKSNILYGDIDLEYLVNERRKNTSFELNETGYTKISYETEEIKLKLNRFINPTPFIPKDEKDKTSEKILDIQAYALKQRMEHINVKNVVIGISGGLDSTYALLAINRAYDLLGYDKKDIITVTMPCFGTSERTYKNTKKLCDLIGTTFLEVNIKDSVLKHFEDINHDVNEHNLTYENSQARERTQVLMDISSKYNGFVVGTGDLSELALGFATYNGDHMSMYSINGSIPKTLIKYLINYFALKYGGELKDVLLDILDTPISPELLPPSKDGNIAQVTEEIVGPYELQDFFLYNFLRLGYTPEKIYYLSKIAFENIYTKEFILECLKKFYFRFFTQQFKRSCMPDGVKIGSVSLSPRADFRMPSDASFKAFMKKLDNLID